MTSNRDQYLNKMLGLDNAADLLDKGIGELVSELNKRNIEHKSADKSADKPTAIVQEAEKQFGSLMLSLIDSQAELLERQDTLESGTSVKSKAADTQATALEQQVKALQIEVAALKEQLNQRPRSASRASETEIENKDLATNLQNALTHRDPMWGLLKDS